MINLCLVVIATQFSETKKRELERMKQERERRVHLLESTALFTLLSLDCQDVNLRVDDNKAS